ncbi:MAG: tRNA (adenosine(37)-N6)-threonylcarbamoyltransferase complex ATPase subunit type 1 TsaE [Clostridia bacterium]|nr:tRNA (adenosine(37)-N6)-threonylcarbamoyltransferase complex ATPase subunit type 1 TsaE [Clostridia bacterium]
MFQIHGNDTMALAKNLASKLTNGDVVILSRRFRFW